MAEAGERDSLPLDYAGPQGSSPRRRWMLRLLLGIVLAFLVVAVIGSLEPYHVSRSRAIRAASANNLHEIGQAISAYSRHYRGQYPDSFPTLLLHENIAPYVFVCLGTNDTPATGPTTQAISGNLLVLGHCSYIYIGNGLDSATVRSNTVVAYEPMANNGGAGMNVLFGDGHVEFVSAGVAGQILGRVSAKVFPVTMPVNWKRRDLPRMNTDEDGDRGEDLPQSTQRAQREQFIFFSAFSAGSSGAGGGVCFGWDSWAEMARKAWRVQCVIGVSIWSTIESTMRILWLCRL
jgi:prepilin-type processing-associated H-X9-DG protein